MFFNTKCYDSIFAVVVYIFGSYKVRMDTEDFKSYEGLKSSYVLEQLKLTR